MAARSHGRPAPELRRPLVAIWAAILAFDGTCRADLVKDGAHQYFVEHLCSLAEDPRAQDRAAALEMDEQRKLAGDPIRHFSAAHARRDETPTLTPGASEILCSRVGNDHLQGGTM